MYDVVDDPYCYPGTTVLRNRLNLRNQADLEAFEADAVALRSDEPLPAGHFSASHYRAIHRHLFQDVYPWAGRYRTVRISKGGSMFCYPENIPSQLRQLFQNLHGQGLLRGQSADAFSAAGAAFLADLNAIHAFREGNGRAQLAIFTVIADQAGHPLDFDRLDPERFLSVMIDSFNGDEAPLAREIRSLI